MDSVVINIVDQPNEVSVNITEAPISVVVNVTQGGSTFQCSDIDACQTIIDIQTDISTNTTDINTVAADLSTHESNTSNPHNVTKAQVGLSNVDNTSDVNKPVSTAQAAAISVVQNDINAHEADQNNPHHVSLDQARSEDNFFTGEVDMNSNRLRNLPTPVNADEAVNKSYVDGLVDNTLKAAEAYNPAITNMFPLTYNTHPIQKGDTFRLSPGTMNGVVVSAEDLLIANVDTPGQIVGNWQILESNREQATETVMGVAKIVTQPVIENELTTNNTDIVTAQKFWFGILRFISLAWTWASKQTFTTAIRLSSTTASQYLKTDANKDVVSIAAIPASDITQQTNLNFVTDNQKLFNDATSSIQTQLNSKLTQGVWSDYSGTSTQVGWSLFTTNKVYCMPEGNKLHFDVFISGTSNSTTTTITLPYNASANMTAQYFPVKFTNNTTGSSTWGMAQINASSNTLTFYRDNNGTAWTGSNTKTVSVNGIIHL